MAKNDVKEGKVVVILLWIIWIVGLIWYLVDEKMRKNTFVKYWLKQWLILLIASVAVSIVGSVIPFVGWFIVLPIGSIILVVFWVIGLVNIIKGVEKLIKELKRDLVKL